jgi:hypothetical protein
MICGVRGFVRQTVVRGMNIETWSDGPVLSPGTRFDFFDAEINSFGIFPVQKSDRCPDFVSNFHNPTP